MNKKEQRIAITRAFKAKLIESQGEDFSFIEDDAVLLFDYKKDGKVFKNLEYFRGMNEVFNPIGQWAEGHGDNTEHDAYEEIVDMLNEELEEIRNQVAEEADVKATKAMFEKINKGLGLAK